MLAVESGDGRVARCVCVNAHKDVTKQLNVSTLVFIVALQKYTLLAGDGMNR